MIIIVALRIHEIASDVILSIIETTSLEGHVYVDSVEKKGWFGKSKNVSLVSCGRRLDVLINDVTSHLCVTTHKPNFLSTTLLGV
jgi:hypothetical protein